MSDGTESDPRPAARIEIAGGGPVSPEQLAAIVVALTPVAAAEGAADTAARTPAWTRAALLENVGLRRIAGPADLVQPGSPL